MTPREKAKELIDKFTSLCWECDDEKDHALITVNEILEMDLPILEEDADKFYDYWEQVKEEIENYEIENYD